MADANVAAVDPQATIQQCYAQYQAVAQYYNENYASADSDQQAQLDLDLATATDNFIVAKKSLMQANNDLATKASKAADSALTAIQNALQGEQDITNTLQTITAWVNLMANVLGPLKALA